MPSKTFDQLLDEARLLVLDIRWRIATRRVQHALKRLAGLAHKAGFNPAQTRVPTGNPDGGQWTGGGGAVGGLVHQVGARGDRLQLREVAGLVEGALARAYGVLGGAHANRLRLPAHLTRICPQPEALFFRGDSLLRSYPLGQLHRAAMHCLGPLRGRCFAAVGSDLHMLSPAVLPINEQ